MKAFLENFERMRSLNRVHLVSLLVGGGQSRMREIAKLAFVPSISNVISKRHPGLKCTFLSNPPFFRLLCESSGAMCCSIIYGNRFWIPRMQFPLYALNFPCYTREKWMSGFYARESHPCFCISYPKGAATFIGFCEIIIQVNPQRRAVNNRRTLANPTREVRKSPMNSSAARFDS